MASQYFTDPVSGARYIEEWRIIPGSLEAERDRLKDGFNREILAAQLLRAGFGTGAVNAFKADVDGLSSRYSKKFDGLASQGVDVSAARTAIATLATAAKAAATSANAVDVPSAI
ncbi:hypothetical protein ACKWRH_25335 [Bradyrhizobium sp. Pa8]|uniref:hypothetical protein n=1 Tax=Bradyrhizobium sp. Pa8 TaxID=3386552 RepID=UPI00403F4E68